MPGIKSKAMNSGTTSIACIGEAMAELLFGEQGTAVGYAGDTLNTAIYCKRQSAAEVAYITRVGTDPLSTALLQFIQSHQIDTSLIDIDNHRQVGIYSVSNDATGERTFHYWRESSAARELFSRNSDQLFNALLQFDIVYLSGITLAIIDEDAREKLFDWLATNRSNTRFAFDSNYRPALWKDTQTAQQIISRAWQLADIALPSLDDELLLFGEPHERDVVSRINSAGCRIGALKRGEKGPLALGSDASQPTDQHYRTVNKVVDTTAAGDSFNGGFLGAILNDLSVAEAMQQGHELAARVIAHHGAIMPEQ